LRKSSGGLRSSALTPTADIAGSRLISAKCQKRKRAACNLDVWFVTPTDIKRALLDHLVNGREDTGRHSDAERFCGLKVDNKLELRWLGDRHIDRLFSL